MKKKTWKSPSLTTATAPQQAVFLLCTGQTNCFGYGPQCTDPLNSCRPLTSDPEGVCPTLCSGD